MALQPSALPGDWGIGVISGEAVVMPIATTASPLLLVPWR